VFVHGSLCDSRVFDAVAANCPMGVEMIALELPDHTRDEPDHDLAATLDALRAELSGLDERYVLVGHSMGAYLVARLLHELEARVSRAVLLSGFADLPTAVLDGYRALVDGVEAGALDPKEALAPAVEAAMGEHVEDPWRRHLEAIVASWPTPRVLRAARRVVEVGHAPAIAGFRVPTVVLHAVDDVSIPAACGRALAALGAQAELRELDRGGHFLPLSSPDLVAALAFASD